MRRQAHSWSDEERAVLEQDYDVETAGLDSLSAARAEILIWTIPVDVDLELPSPKEGAHAIDLRYGRELPFLGAARSLGYQVHDGMPMLLHQALEQFRLFTGRAPEPGDFEAIRMAVGNHGE